MRAVPSTPGAGPDAAPAAAPATTTAGVVLSSVVVVGLAALSIGCAVGAVLLHRYVTLRTDQPVALDPADLVLAAAFPPVAALVLLYQPRNLVGWLLLTTALTGPYLLAAQYAAVALLPGRSGLPGQGAATWFAVWGYVPYLALWGLVPSLFPDGRLPSGRWRVPVAATAVVIGCHLVARMICPTPLDVSSELLNPYGLRSAPWLRYVTLATSEAVLFGGGLLGLAAVLTRLRRSRGVERAKLQWLVLGVASLVGASLIGLILQGPQDLAAGMGVGMVLLVAAIGVGAVRHRLFDIGTALSRTLVYGLLTTFLLIAYACAVAGAGALAPGRRVAYGVLAVAALVAAAARDQVQRLVDRVLFGVTRDPYAVLAVLHGRLDLATGPMDALSQLADGVREALKVPYVAVESADDRLTTIESGRPVGWLERLPAPTRAGGVAGTLLVGRRHRADQFTAAERAMFADIARRAGDLLDAAATQHDLRRSRERVVAAREEERRRLRRDLHDGVGPQLAAMAMQLDSIADGLAERSDPAAERAALVRDRLRATVRDIRHIVEDLRPPALDEGGLSVALAQVIAPFTPVVALDAPADLAVLGLPAATEVAAFRIVAEAVTNAVRHSRCDTCVVRVRAEPPWLVVEVADDGAGLAGDAVAGIGLRSIRERASEVGGRLEVLSSSDGADGGGTLVRARLPLEEGSTP
ncbi:sensor histidine kinase [Frankia sp. AgB1.9]|uniref:sensor histidine kinase n=1 Tax=unclassified Frankia TaxID=2632575 RepID=UPI001932877A|nr:MULTISPECIES: sensor histidine kinase [unclassified Frankia]MBL7492856.1 sensor histidine kinase [Frankia sp. AgW1.1]MBL7549188.1 sensor histidine kinase [Frankia sp. AgB1.9]MBL7623664.1 sensor histidine kinase [Frankia sp. AgB1.8]